MCNENDGCEFFTWTPVQGSVAICRGSSGEFVKDVGKSVVSIKKSKLEENIDGYRILANYQAVCDTSNLIAVVPGVFSLDDASSACRKEPSCTFFTMSTSAQTDGLPNRNQNMLWLCSGQPKFAYHSGWLAAAKDGVSHSLPSGRSATVMLDGPA
jgi:hypothetical protein